MIIDLNIPFIEFRLRLQLFCAERMGEIFKFIQFDLKIPRISWEMLFNHGYKYGFILYRHWQVIEIGKLPRAGCWKIVFLNKLRRNYYDGYPVKE